MKFRGPQPPGNVPGKLPGKLPGEARRETPAAKPKAAPRRRLNAGSPIKSAGASVPKPVADKPAPPIKPRTRLRRPVDTAAPAPPPNTSEPRNADPQPARSRKAQPGENKSNHPFQPAKPVVPSTGQHKTQNANDNILASKIRELIVKELQAGSKPPAPVKPNVKPKVRRTSVPPRQPASNQNQTHPSTDKTKESEQQQWCTEPAPSHAGPHIATYHRELPVGLTRLYETILDWRNPPPLHGSGYAKIDCLTAGDSGWRIRVTRTNPQNQTFEMELRIDRLARRWICKVLSGPDAGTQIWTQAVPVGRRHTDIVVDVFVPGVTRSNFAETIGIYTKLYTDLFDRNIDRMLARQAELDRPSPDSAVQKKTANERRGRVDFIQGTKAYLFDPGRTPPAAPNAPRKKIDGQLIAHVLECDYMRHAASTWSVTDHIVQCPHHKVRFDLRTGRRVVDRLSERVPTQRIRLDPRSGLVTSLMAETKPAQSANDGHALR